MPRRKPAGFSPPGEVVKQKLQKLGWSQTTLAEVLGRPVQLVNEIVAGKKAITPETARGLADAFGTEAEFWLDLELRYRLALADPVDAAVARRARLYARFPVPEMVKRHWIEPSRDIDKLESQITAFFGLNSIDDEPSLRHAAKKRDYSEPNPTQLAWLFRVRYLAKAMPTRNYSEQALRDVEQKLRLLRHEPAEMRHVPRLLAEAGVRFLIVEALPRSEIDGVCFWLNGESPVIAVTTRHDRIDNAWFVLRHEIEHVLRRDGRDRGIIDTNLDEDGEQVAGGQPPEERAANAAAAEFCVPDSEIRGFIARTRPLYSEAKIVGFAKRIGVHPGLVVGQLQRRKELPYSHLRKLLVKVRDLIAPSAITDGWGSVPQVRP